MTIEEAIRILESMKSEMLLVFDHDRKEALKLAITALQAQNVPDTNVGDTISRQAAIDAVHEEWDECLNYDGSGQDIAQYTEDALWRLPSAQPERKKISEEKIKIVIENYFKDECDVNTSIKSAFEKGFRTGVKKGMEL